MSQRMHYNNESYSDNPLSAAMRAKGWTDFEITGSRIQNEWSGYWIESDSHKEIDGKWIGQTFKDALWTVRNNFPDNKNKK